MAIRVTLDDHTGNISQPVNMAETAPVEQLIPGIITSLKLPITDNAGRPITYHLSHNNLRLQENETLASAGVQAGDTLTIVPEMTAGGPEFLTHLETAIREIMAAREELLNLPLSSLYADGADSPSTVHIRIAEEPLTAQNLTTIISALTGLHTKCWLIQQRRFGDLIDYTQTLNERFAVEANLVISKLTHNSPADIKFSLDVSPTSVVEAVIKAIDGIVKAPLRYEESKLENLAKALETQRRELDAQSVHADQEQARQIAAQEAELAKQKSLLIIEQQQLEIEGQRLEIQEKRLDIEKKRIDYALEIATTMVGILRPDADSGTKELLLRTLLPDLSQLGNGRGLELVSPLQETQKPGGTLNLLE